MSVLEGPRKEIRHVMKDGSAYWVEYKDGKIFIRQTPVKQSIEAWNDTWSEFKAM